MCVGFIENRPQLLPMMTLNDMKNLSKGLKINEKIIAGRKEWEIMRKEILDVSVLKRAKNSHKFNCNKCLHSTEHSQQLGRN